LLLGGGAQVDVTRRALGALRCCILYTQPEVRLVAVKRDALAVPSLVGFGVQLELVLGIGIGTSCLVARLGRRDVEANVGASELVVFLARLLGVAPSGVTRSAEQVDVVAGAHTDGFHERGRQQFVELRFFGRVLRLPDRVRNLLHRGLHGVGDGGAEVLPQHAIPAIGCEVGAAGDCIRGVAVVLVAEFGELVESVLTLVELPEGVDLDENGCVVGSDGFDRCDLVSQACDAAVGDEEVARSTRDVVRFLTRVQSHALVGVDGVVNLRVVACFAVSYDPPAHAGGRRDGATAGQGYCNSCCKCQTDGDTAKTFLHFSPWLLMLKLDAWIRTLLL